MTTSIFPYSYLNIDKKSLSFKPSLWKLISIAVFLLIALGTVASMRASRLGNPHTFTMSATSDSVPLLCLGANLQVMHMKESNPKCPYFKLR